MSIVWFVATLIYLFYLDQKLPGVGQDGWSGSCNTDPGFSRNVDEKLKAVFKRIQSPKDKNFCKYRLDISLNKSPGSYETAKCLRWGVADSFCW